MRLRYQAMESITASASKIVDRGECCVFVPEVKGATPSVVVLEFDDYSISFPLEEFKRVANYVLYRKRVVRKKYKDNVVPFPGGLK